ncbi:M16 family metallopeptidase [Sneathiella chinensis]|nr:pitrilysin family protein [Sneathiella chinensis]
MKKLFGTLLPAFQGVVCLLIVLSAPQVQAKASQIEEVVSPGGIRAWLVQERSIPIISMEVAWRGGASVEPAEKAGLATLVASTMDEGAGELDSRAFQKALSELAISLSFQAGKDSFQGSLKTLSKNRDEAFRLFGMAVTQPRFDEEPVNRIRNQILVSLNRALSSPNTLASRAWFQEAFPDHAYGIPSKGTLETVPGLSRDDLAGYAKRMIARDNMVIAVVGDIGSEELGRYLDDMFGTLPAKADYTAPKAVEPRSEAVVRIIEQDIPQSVIMFGGQGVKRDDPDYYAAYVLNYILGGGGFESRLTEEIREKRGLVYSVYSYLYPFEAAGVHIGGMGTRNDAAVQALGLLKAELAKIRKDGVSDAELAAAKTYLNGSFPLRLSSNSRIADILLSMQLSHLPPAYLGERDALINAVTPADIRRVAKRLMDPDKLIVVVVGKPAGLSETMPEGEKQ